MHGELTLAGQRIRCFDSVMPHDFALTPAMSLFVECESAGEFAVVFAELARGDITIDGRALAGQTIRAGLVDEFQMIVCPTIGSSGTRFFPD